MNLLDWSNAGEKGLMVNASKCRQFKRKTTEVLRLNSFASPFRRIIEKQVQYHPNKACARPIVTFYHVRAGRNTKMA